MRHKIEPARPALLLTTTTIIASVSQVILVGLSIVICLSLAGSKVLAQSFQYKLEPMPPGWVSHSDQGQSYPGVVLQIYGGDWGVSPGKSGVVIDVLARGEPMFQSFENFRNYAMNEDYGFNAQPVVEEVNFNGYPAFRNLVETPTRIYVWYYFQAGDYYIAIRSDIADLSSNDIARWKSEHDQVLKGLSFPGSPPPSAPAEKELRPCKAVIHLPADLKPGEVLSPSYVITDQDGNAPKGEVYPVLYINGVQTHSVVWDGNEARIDLQVSCQGYPLAVTAVMPAYGAPPPPPADTTVPRDADPPVIPPLDDYSGGGSDYDSSPAGLSKIPPPENAGQAMAGIVIPGIISVILGILGQPGGVVAPSGGSGSSAAKAGSTQVLQGEEALEWLEQNGMVRKVDGRYAKKTGDWNNATAPGTGMRGFVESSQSDSAAVDSDMVILVEIPGAPSSPDQYEFPRESDVEIPEEPDYTDGDDVETEEPQSKKTRDKEPESEQEIVEEPELESDEESEPESESKPGLETEAETDPDAEIDSKSEIETKSGPEGKDETEDKGDTNSDSDADTELTSTQDTSSPQGVGAVQTGVQEGKKVAGDVVAATKEISGTTKGYAENLESLQTAIVDLKDLSDNLDLSDKDRETIEQVLRDINQPLEEIRESLGALNNGLSTAQEYAEKHKEIMERAERVVQAYTDMHKRLPDYLDDRNRMAISTYAGAFQAAGEAIDKTFRSIPTIGDQLADALETAKLGEESGKFLETAVRNVTAHDKRVHEELAPYLRKLEDGHTQFEDLPSDVQETFRQAGVDPYKLRDRALKLRELEYAQKTGNRKFIRENYPDIYDEMKKEELKSYHPVPGSVPESSAISKVLGRILDCLGI